MILKLASKERILKVRLQAELQILKIAKETHNHQYKQQI
jgi:hypothetical protein